jgi:L,D-transpeptidase catalytic domain
MMMNGKKTFKKLGMVISSFFIFLIHLPFVFAKSVPKTAKQNNKKTAGITWIAINDSFIKPIQKVVTDSIKAVSDSTISLYDELKLQTFGLSKNVFDYTIKGYKKMIGSGKLVNPKIISIVDFSQPSANKRLYVIDLETKKVLFNTYVAHGKNSGQEMATEFSNTPTSNKSSLGFYLTSHTYSGKNGYSLQLEGQERGINDNALNRGIVMHAAEYVNENYIQSQGWIGRSQGCPAVMPEMNKPIVETIKEGSCFFIYSPDPNYLQRSSILN